ncbi:unnamed protein product [Brassica oleracea]
MVGGEGPESYNQNSSYQSKTSLMQLKTSTAKETGQNPAENIEFQVLFNDFTTNDFNTLFQSLPAGRRYYSAGVPGSFFERVLPKESFHIGVINYAFHFTSKIPKGITDRDSPSWNRDMHYTGFNKAVKKAYLDQYSADTKILLDARADELVPGGLMLLFGSCLRDGVKMSETSKGIVLDAVGASLNNLAQQGVIEQDKVDSFSTPLHFAEENLKQIIEENGRFTIEAFEDIIHAKGEFTLDPKVLAVSCRASFGTFPSQHFGEQVFTKVFDLIEAMLRQELPRLLNSKPGMQYLIVLRKKN